MTYEPETESRIVRKPSVASVSLRGPRLTMFIERLDEDTWPGVDHTLQSLPFFVANVASKSAASYGRSTWNGRFQFNVRADIIVAD